MCSFLYIGLNIHHLFIYSFCCHMLCFPKQYLIVSMCLIYQAPEFNTPQMKEEASSSSKCQSCLSSSMGNSEILRIMSLPNFMMTPNSINLDSTTMPLLDTIETDHHNKSSTQTPLQHSFTHLPFLPESQDSVLGLSESNFLDVSASTRQAVELENVSQINFGSPFLELDGTGRNDGRADSFFDELPADMFDYL
ncbi:hypothetical protein HYC85_026713 [Camellia sinensis]|uniref:Uncharacterized protein n=1 Tax=Camellia sinensis TaxID=4442 RepID=A0A7J7G8B8_CAMSI|nr:hypothetical protein HYC85_026713 [Camellia sinensis]